MATGIEHFRLGDGSMLVIHAKERCKPPCVFHSPLPGPWEDWPISFKATPFTNGDQIPLRTCPHGWSHPAVEQLPFWSERGLDHLAQHLCCGCPCVPDGVLPPELRKVLDAGPMPVPQNPAPPVEETAPEHDPIIHIPALGIDTKSWFGITEVKKSVIVAALGNDGFSRDRKARAQQILFAWEAKQLLPEMPALPAHAAFDEPGTVDKDPNKVAEKYLASIERRIDSSLHKALVLLASTHTIYSVEKRDGGRLSNFTHSVECEGDCCDWFKESTLETDDNQCVTLKLAILGGYVPVEWSAKDDDD